METKLEINKELECKQLLREKLAGDYNNENWCIIYLIMITLIIEILVKMIVIPMNKDKK